MGPVVERVCPMGDSMTVLLLQDTLKLARERLARRQAILAGQEPGSAAHKMVEGWVKQDTILVQMLMFDLHAARP